jgi:hypothetical protein
MCLSSSRLRALVVLSAILAVPACSSSVSGPRGRLAAGSWGGERIGVDVETARVAFLFDCAGGLVDHPIDLDAAGNFDALGTFTGGGNARDADHSPHVVRYTGHATPTHLHVTRTLLDGSLPPQTFDAVRGGPRQIIAC